MPRQPKTVPAARGADRSNLRDLLGPAPLLEGEVSARYDALYDRVLVAVQPSDPLEEIWVRDIVDLLWETLRLRRLKAQLMEADAHKGLDRLLTPLVDTLRRRSLLEGWAARNAGAVKDVNSILKKAGLDQDAIHAQTLSLKLDTFERIDRMIMQTEARRNVALREIDRHRDVVAQRLRDASKEIVDAEFAEIAPQNGAGA